MSTSSSPALPKRWIGLELRRLRTTAGKSRPEVAERLKQSKTAVGHLETARNLPSAAVLEVLLGFYGVPDRLPFFLDLIDAARKGRNWWEKLGAAVPGWFDLFLGLEAGAADVFSFDSYLLQGLLQIPEYAEAVVRAETDFTDEEVRQRVELRRGRQTILDRQTDPVRLWVVIDESVLYRRRGGPDVMAAQIEHLMTLSHRPRIDLQVLPFTATAHIAQQGSFQLMKFPPEMVGDPGIVYLDQLPAGRYYEDPDDIKLYERAMTQLQVAAASQEDSRALMERAIKEVTR